MDKKYQIFISSTYRDLIEEREKVRDVILEMYQFPIGMEMFSAADEEQWEIIKETIDSSDYYILIIGKRYGSVFEDGPDKGMSYTEKEYRYAQSIGVPTLVYIKDEGVITADKIEDDPKKLKRLKVFTDEVSKGREVKWFKTVDELGKEVSVSLYKEMKRKKRPGWIRGDSVDIEKSLSEIVELSQLNRELQEENKKLAIELERRNSKRDRKPFLTLTLKATEPSDDDKYPELYQHSQFMTIDADDTVHIKLKRLLTREIEAEFHPLTRSDFGMELQRFVTDQEIRDYNNSLPSTEEIEKYIQAYKLYLRIKENGIATTFLVNNLGTAKATDVSVTIEFPDQMCVFDIYKAAEYDEPVSPKKGENLITKAMERAKRELAIALDLKTSGIPELSRGYDVSALFDPMPRLNNNTVFESIEIEDNIVEIENRQGIVHSKFAYYTGSYIIPFIPGEYEAKVTIMCAEYEDPEETVIKFVVEE